MGNRRSLQGQAAVCSCKSGGREHVRAQVWGRESARSTQPLGAQGCAGSKGWQWRESIMGKGWLRSGRTGRGGVCAQAPTVTLTRHCAHQSELTTGQHSHLEQRIDGWSGDAGSCGGQWGEVLAGCLENPAQEPLASSTPCDYECKTHGIALESSPATWKHLS